jgi:hypothetical protein
MIISLFASALLVGMGFALLGVGRAVRYGEVSGDAADAVAFSTAVIDARALNVVALFNMVKLSLAAVSITTQAVSAAATATSTFILANPAFAFAQPAVTALGAQATNLQATNQPVIDEVLAAISEAEQIIAAELPEYGDEIADEIARRNLRKAGFLAPLQPLPLAPEEKLAFCERVLPFATANQALEPIPAGPLRQVAEAAFEQARLPLCLQFPATATRLTPEALLGTEVFQRRGYVLADPLPLSEEEGVRVATWRQDEAGGGVADLRAVLSQVGLAQAELYFDGALAAEERLWQPSWRARMRRYRDPDDFAEFTAGCGRRGGGEVCGAAAEALAASRALILH